MRKSQGRRLSLCMIARDEEIHLERCLRSVQSVVDEIILVDTGSTDGTVEIATSMGARVVHHQWNNDFAAARNVSLAHAGGDWILVLDADEELDSDSREDLLDMFKYSDISGWQVILRSLMPAATLEQYRDSYYTRLFQNRPYHRYTGKIHEQIRPSIEEHYGSVRRSPVRIIHHGYAEPLVQGGNDRRERNLNLVMASLEEYPQDPYLNYHAGRMLKEQGQHDEAVEFLEYAIRTGEEVLTAETVEQAYTSLAQISLARDNVADAYSYARKSLLMNPESVVAIYLAAICNLYQANFEDAFRCFSEIKQHPRANLASENELDQLMTFCRSKIMLRAN